MNIPRFPSRVPARVLSAAKALKPVLDNPYLAGRLLKRIPSTLRALTFAETYSTREMVSREEPELASRSENALAQYFHAHAEGRGIWKWEHYFDAYTRHLGRFVGRDAHVLEIGIYSGGSLDMWRDYFGPSCRMYGVDIEPACTAYARPGTEIFIGDQSDRAFWRSFRERVPKLDVVIDDGGHHPEQQIATLEELLPHLRPGGVYLCEDVHGAFHEFTAYVRGLVETLNAMQPKKVPNGLASEAKPFQRFIASVHTYPFLTVIECNGEDRPEFNAPKHGTEWQPFYERPRSTT